MIEYITIGCLFLSNLITGVFLYLSYKKIKHLKNSHKDKQLDTNATELLAELMSGGAVVVANVVDRDSIFQWSPKVQR